MLGCQDQHFKSVSSAVINDFAEINATQGVKGFYVLPFIWSVLCLTVEEMQRVSANSRLQ